MKVPPVSYTGHKDFENCPRKFWHRHVARDLPKEDSEAMRWGNLVHKAMEQYINDGVELPKEMPYEHTVKGLEAQAEVKLGVTEDGSPCDFFAADCFFRGVVDVLISNDHTAIIIDHKTGKVREDRTELDYHSVLVQAHHPELERIFGWYNWLKEGKMGVNYRLNPNETWGKIKATQNVICELLHHGAEGFAPRQNPLCPWCPVTSCEFHP